MTDTISAGELRGSRFADTKVFPGEGAQANISLAKVVSTDEKSRAWRITLARLDRADGYAPNLHPIFLVQQQNYAAGSMDQDVGEAIPPRRDNPVFSSISPGNNSDVEPCFVQIAWGMSGGATCRLVAHWPAMGGSIVVEGSYVEVFGGGALFDPGIPPIPEGSWPKFSAHIAPVDGLSSESAGELSLQLTVPVEPEGGQDGILTSLDFEVPGDGFTGLTKSAVFSVAPFTKWNATITPINPFARPNVYIATDPGSGALPQVEVLDHFKLVAGVFVASPGDVAIRINTNLDSGPSTLTIGQLEAAINAGSSLIQITGPNADPQPAFFVNNWLGGGGPDVDLKTGVAAMSALTQGGTQYVPDFARRVRVQMAETTATSGPPAVLLVFYDDQGDIVDQIFQGSIAGFGIVAPEFNPVPGRAVLLKILGSSGDRENAIVHWRIAP